MKKRDIVFGIIVLIEAVVTAIIYWFFSPWDGGYCGQPSILNPLGKDAPGNCILIALHRDMGGVSFYVALDVLILTVLVYGVYRVIRRK